MDIYVGIDNGISGAIAALRSNHTIALLAPVQSIKAGKSNKLDVLWVRERLRGLQQEASGGRIVICPEQAQKFSPGKMALCSSWHCWGSLEAVFALEGLPYQPIDPQKWQKVMFAGIPRNKGDDTKAISIEVARRLYPNVSLLPTPRCTIPDSGLSDALLIATYALRAQL
jgi:hypothetical protein